MPAITKFIIALDPAAPCYALSFDVSPSDIFRNTAATRAVATPDRTKAHRFDTFEEARETAADITGWGGAQRVEPILVDFGSTPDLGTAQGRIDARDAATQAADGIDDVTARFCAAVTALRELNLPCAVVWSDETSLPTHIDVTDVNGNGIALEWDAMVDGFEYPTSGDDACDLNEQAEQHEDEPETAFCDGCEGCFPVDEVEVCGDADHGSFGICKTCRAKDEQAQRHFRGEPICAGCDGLFPLREGQTECETCAAARSIVNPVTAAVIAATEELYDYRELAETEAERQPILDEDAVTDLLTNLRHAAAADGIDFDELVAISARHFAAEVKVQADIARKRAEQANG